MYNMLNNVELCIFYLVTLDLILNRDITFFRQYFLNCIFHSVNDVGIPCKVIWLFNSLQFLRIFSRRIHAAHLVTYLHEMWRTFPNATTRQSLSTCSPIAVDVVKCSTGAAKYIPGRRITPIVCIVQSHVTLR